MFLNISIILCFRSVSWASCQKGNCIYVLEVHVYVTGTGNDKNKCKLFELQITREYDVTATPFLVKLYVM